MASGRVLVVHESGATRALLTELLAREDLRVEATDSSFQAIARFVDEPFELVVLGLGGLAHPELDVIPALKAEEHAPRVVVTFPSPRRDLAVRALRLGADGYVLEPFYGDEIVAIVKGQLAPRDEAAPSASLVRLARDVAHSVNNPLQVLTLLLQKDKVTKKELVEGFPDQVKRIQQVVKHLRDFGAVATAAPEPCDPVPLFKAALERATLEGDAETDVPLVQADRRNLVEALVAVFEAVQLRCGVGARLNARLVAESEGVAVRLAAPAEPFADERPTDLLDAVFVVQPERDVLPGLARARALLEGMGGSLNVHVHETRLVFVARLRKAEASRASA